MKRTITQNDIMMYIVENNITDEYIKETNTTILFNFVDGHKANRIDLLTFTQSRLNDNNYEFVNLEVMRERRINGKSRFTFNFIKV